MGYKLPNLGQDDNAIPELSNTKLTGTTKITGELQKEGVAISATAADLNLLEGLAASGLAVTRSFEVEISCPNGTAKTGAIFTVPAGSVILDVCTICTEAFNGGTTKNFAVGVTGNNDKYIDPVDCPVTLAGVMDIFGGTNQDQKTYEVCAAAVPIIYLYTNSATATAGKMKVKIIYVP